MENRSNVVEQLNSFLRGELSAVETYRQALERLQSSTASGQLRECLTSHQQRVGLLRSRIQLLGGQPAEDSGAWGAFVKAIEGGATAFGEKAAIAVLEEGEDHGLRDYKADLDKLDNESRRLIESQILPAQQQTHRALSTLKHSMN
jgi:demethoxyubiquinone hydroxylase (CLK1/Coq7/Cat5 family)